jgi:hypothetical protein
MHQCKRFAPFSIFGENEIDEQAKSYHDVANFPIAALMPDAHSLRIANWWSLATDNAVIPYGIETILVVE